MARARFWTTEAGELVNSGTTQSIISLTSVMRARQSSAVQGYTLARVLGKITNFNDTSETSAALGAYALGIGRYTQLVDGVDLPSLGSHEGDWLWYTSCGFKGAGTGLTEITPEIARNVEVDSKSMRVLERDSDDIFLSSVLQDTSVALRHSFNLSLLWLLP